MLMTQVGGLTLDSELTSMAQQWAEHLASSRALKHSHIQYRGLYIELIILIILIILMLMTQVGSLTLDSELMSMAQQWAEHLASIRALKHSHIQYRGQPVGENVAAKSGTATVDYTG